MRTWFFAAVAMLVLLCTVGRAEPTGPAAARPKSDDTTLDGTWLPHSADGWGHSLLPDLRAGKLVIRGRSFALSKYRGLDKDVTGTFSLGASTNPKTLDIHSDEIDLSPNGEPTEATCTSGTWR